MCTVAEYQGDTVSRKQVADAVTVTRAASRITELVLDCTDPERLAAFWGEVLGYDVLDRDDEWVEIGQGDDVSWYTLADPEGNEFCLLSGRADP